MLFNLLIYALACKPVPTQTNFNLSEYTRASWYVHYRQGTAYLPSLNNYCVVATYDMERGSADAISVHNYASFGLSVGASVGRNSVLCAKPKHCFTPAKLRVGLCWLPDFFASDYWVLAAGPSPQRYDWAIVSGGQPTNRLRKYFPGIFVCTGDGLWLLSRNATHDQNQVDKQLQILKEMGVTTKLLNKVEQEGCDYSDMFIK